MPPEKVELLEQTVMALVVQAITDYREDAVAIFREETDLPQNIAEDVTREAVDSMGVPSTHDRLYGKVDIKKAIYAFLPEPTEVALMLDARAEEQSDGAATVQMPQNSMRVKMMRAGEEIDAPGRLEQVMHRGDRTYQVVTIIAKYVYEEIDESQNLHRIIVACIPNGILQDKYNPTPADTIWLAGRDAPTLGEDSGVRLSYRKLQEKASWRVREIELK